MKRIALISGATAGIGKATAILLAKNEFDIIITGRRNDRLDELKQHILKTTQAKVHVLNFDVRDLKQVNSAIESLPEEWKSIDVLVNNAGLAAGLGAIQDGDIEDWEKMIDTNIKGLLYLTKKVVPILVNKKKGHIVNICSIAGKEVYPNGNVYCASKYAVDALTKSMRIDLLPHNIKVSQIAPGMVNTEFSEVRFHGDKAKADKVYEGLEPLIAEDIADAILYVLTRPDHVCINDLIITPTAQASATNVIRK
jgi:NADP-dependent 3-hydroxy acid dehydrogenase YdfG